MITSYTFRSLDVNYRDAFMPQWFYEKSHKSLLHEQRNIKQNEANILWANNKLRSMENNSNKLKFSKNNSEETQYAEEHTFQYGSAKMGLIQLYGKTMEGVSIRCDVPFCPYFAWKFPSSFSRDDCFRFWKSFSNISRNLSIKQYNDSSSNNGINENNEKNNNSISVCLDDLVYFVEFVELEDAQRFNFHRTTPYLKLHFLSKRDMKQAQQWLHEFDWSSSGPKRWSRMVYIDCLNTQIPSKCVVPVNEIPIRLFETRIDPVHLWDRHWYNPNAWLSTVNNQFYKVEESIRILNTTCDVYICVKHPNLLSWDKTRMDIPPLVVEVWDLETRGLKAKEDPNFRLLTSCSIFYRCGGIKNGSSTKEPADPELMSIECVLWQPTDPIENVTIFEEKTEEDAIKKIIERRRENQTDILVTHNGLDFDIVVLRQRMEVLNMAKGSLNGLGKDLKEWSRVKTKGEDGEYMGVTHSGIIHVDNLIFYRSFFGSELRSKTLKFILGHFFNNEEDAQLREHLDKDRDSVQHPNALIRSFCQKLHPKCLINSKIDLHFEKIAPMFFSGDPQQVKELLEYNVTDVFQTARLEIKHSIVATTLAFAAVFEITGNVYYSQGAEIKCMVRLWREIYELGCIYNQYEFPQDDPKLYSSPQSGGKVQQAVVGRYSGAGLIDVKSMYPSIILEYYLCKSTLVEKRFLTAEDWELLNKEWNYKLYCVQDEDIIVVDGPNEHHVIPPNRKYAAAYFPLIEGSLKKERAVYKNLAQQYEGEGNTLMYTLYTAMEKAVKVLMNAYYGLNGQQGINICAQQDIRYDSVEVVEKRNAMYQRVAEELKQKKDEQSKKCFYLYTSAAECVKQIFAFFPTSSPSHGNYNASLSVFSHSNDVQQHQRFLQACDQERHIHSQIMQNRHAGGYWPFWPLAALITHLGRQCIETTKELVLSHFHPCTIPYGDTDSLVVSSGSIRLDQFPNREQFEIAVYKQAMQMEKLVNDYWKNNACQKGYIEFELEAIYRELLLPDTKKYYYGQQLKIKENKQDGTFVIKPGKLKIAGLELKKRDKAGFLRKIQSNIVKLQCQGQIAQSIEETKNMVQMLARQKVGIDDLTMVQMLNHDPNEMVNLSVAAAVALQNSKIGLGVARSKQEISFVYVRKPGMLHNDRMNTTDIVMDASEAKRLNVSLNFDYYLQNHFRNPICRLLTCVCPNIETLYDEWISSAQCSNLKLLFSSKSANSGDTSDSINSSGINKKRDFEQTLKQVTHQNKSNKKQNTAKMGLNEQQQHSNLFSMFSKQNAS